MVRYITMRRITKILASILFVISVITVYLAFDFAINSALVNKDSSSPHKHPHHNGHKHLHGHDHDHHKIKTEKKSFEKLVTTSKKFNRTTRLNPLGALARNPDKQHHLNDDHEQHPDRHLRSVKQPPARAKSGGFHKGKTGVKVNQPAGKPSLRTGKNIKRNRNKSTTTTATLSRVKRHQ